MCVCVCAVCVCVCVCVCAGVREREGKRVCDVCITTTISPKSYKLKMHKHTRM